jgi:hypothetical protein
VLQLLLSLAAHVAGAACPADAASIEAELQWASAAAQAVEWSSFERAVDALHRDLSCSCAALSDEQHQRIHLVFALAASRRRDEAAAVAAYRAVLAAEPDFEPPYADAPPGSLLRRAWKQAVHGGPDPVRLVPAGSWRVDGRPAARLLPAERAALVQRFDDGGGCASWYLEGPWPAELQDSLLALPAQGALAELPGSAELLRQASGYQCVGPQRSWWVPGLALVAVGAAGVTTGELLENRMMATDDEGRARRLYRTAVGVSFLGWSVGLGGGGLAVGSLLQACEPAGTQP